MTEVARGERRGGVEESRLSQNLADKCTSKRVSLKLQFWIDSIPKNQWPIFPLLGQWPHWPYCFVVIVYFTLVIWVTLAVLMEQRKKLAMHQVTEMKRSMGDLAKFSPLRLGSCNCGIWLPLLE